MPLIGHCERCREEKPIRARLARVKLLQGPDGERLCREHHVEAWDERMSEND